MMSFSIVDDHRIVEVIRDHQSPAACEPATMVPRVPRTKETAVADTASSFRARAREAASSLSAT